MTTIEWFSVGQKIPPVKERLLLIVSAESLQADKQLEGQSEIEIGFWSGHHFKVLSTGLQVRLVTHWAAASCLPEGVRLIHQRQLDPDVRG